MLQKACFALVIIFVFACQAQEVQLDDLINNIFKNGSSFPPVPTKVTVLNPVPTVNRNEPPNPTPVEPIPETNKYKSCGLNRECVPRFLCNNGAIIEDGLGVIDIRIDNECSYLEECCDVPDKITVPIVDPVPPVKHEGCGYRNPIGVGYKIVGDKNNEAQFGEFPWMVAVLKKEETISETLNLYECGGAIIAPNVILTAAHCVYTKKSDTLVVRAGEWDTQHTTEILPYQDRYVTEIIVHEQFNKGSLYNDIALLITKTPFDWEENIRPVCLPTANINFDHSRCFATGWGKDKFGREGQYQVILKKIDMPVVPNDQCQSNLRLTRLGKYFRLHSSFICAGGEKDMDTCKGDGGSPLVCPIVGVKDRYYQAGIVAWGIGCGDENTPGVYASVSNLRPWIDHQLSQIGIDFKYFTP
ncbi:phenoloxidase-activating factor 2-like [Teleopsis dalmanni]|uniref:phenoloxidase-activating factor 2-like n=1 Tax=Teleopsis dalmanni TaxID=139649 RepID=UPI0018CCDFA1|nr:phenoloxidase-activating factor 2-like [Teleopsis dalmanni]